jgi:nucleotide-binding universal stress UspA family protein
VHNYSESSSDDLETTRKTVQQFVDNVAGETAETSPEVTVNAAIGGVVEELMKASRDADMLVVGSRGSGGFARLLTGSVSSQVVHHAACPVVCHSCCSLSLRLVSIKSSPDLDRCRPK